MERENPDQIAGRCIGIVGGMGPEAGVALSSKVIAETDSSSDSGHLPQILFSFPSLTPDRTAFITGEIKNNPGYIIADLIERLERAGATIAAIACNSAHAPQIFDLARRLMAEKGLKIELLHIIDETAHYLKERWPDISKVGILSTTGTYVTRLYDRLNSHEIETIWLSPKHQERLHSLIYHQDRGIKARAGRLGEEHREQLVQFMEIVAKKGAEAIVLGCTELPLAFGGEKMKGIPVVDPATATARALIRHISPEKLKKRV